MEKVINFKDKNIKFVLLDSYTTYLIDGEIVKTEGSYKGNNIAGVKNIDDIRLVTNTTITTGYTDGENIISIENYEAELNKLASKGEFDEDFRLEFKDIDDEYNYKRFKLKYNPIKKEIQEISDPIKVQIVDVVYDTGNPYIKNTFLNGRGTKYELYTYDREKAWIGIVSDCFKELEMVFSGDCNYSQTNNKKIWGNSTHNCIRYVTAFGTYVFGDEFKSPFNSVGTLTDMIKEYEKDKDRIEEIIKRKYKKHFNNISLKDINFEKVLNNLESVERNLKNITSIKKTADNLNRAERILNETIKYIEDLHTVAKDLI